MGTIATTVNNVVSAVKPVTTFIGKHWKQILFGGLCAYTIIISIAFFLLVNSANRASAKSKLDAIATAGTITKLNDDLATTKANLAKSEATVSQQSDIIKSIKNSSGGIASTSGQITATSGQLNTIQQGLDGTNADATELNRRAIEIVGNLIKSSK
jgi:hypothetical protein